MPQLLKRSLLVVFGLLFGVLATEIGLRVIYPDGGLPAAHLQRFTAEVLASFREDPECGYLPVPGGGEYGPEGCLTNDYDVKQRKGTRVLFVGDSATHRGKLVAALRQLYGDTKYEYWNAGVESFNTLQELVLYRRYNSAIQPDHVVLTFHNNDFQATPLVMHEKGELKVYAPGMHVNQWLFRNSYLYRWAWPRTEPGDRNDRARQVLRNLTDFKSLLSKQNVRFSMVLLPLFKPLAKWDNAELWSREQSLKDFKELGLRHFDLLNVSETALKEGVSVEESGGDIWHPSPPIAERLATELYRQGLLEKDSQ